MSETSGNDRWSKVQTRLSVGVALIYSAAFGGAITEARAFDERPAQPACSGAVSCALSTAQKANLAACFRPDPKNGVACSHGMIGTGYGVNMSFDTEGHAIIGGVAGVTKAGGTQGAYALKDLPAEGCYSLKMQRYIAGTTTLNDAAAVDAQGKCTKLPAYPLRVRLWWKTQCSPVKDATGKYQPATTGTTCLEGANVVVTPEIVADGNVSGMGTFTIPVAPEIPVNSKSTVDQAKEACENMSASGFTWDTTSRICRKKAQYICEQELRMNWIPKSGATLPQEQGTCSAGLAACSSVPVLVTPSAGATPTIVVSNLSSLCTATSANYCTNYSYTGSNAAGVQCQCVGTATGKNALGRSCNSADTVYVSATATPSGTSTATSSPTASATPTSTSACALAPGDYLDDDNSCSGFGGATAIGAVWDSAKQWMTFGNANGCDGNYSSCSPLDASWTPKFASLVQYVQFNGSSNADGGSVTASIGTPGTLHNGDGSCGYDGSSPRFQNAMKFNSGNTWVDFGNVTAFNAGTNAFTFSFWMNSSANNMSGMQPWGKRRSGGHDNFWGFRINGAGAIGFELDQDTSATNYGGVSNATNLIDGTWHHIVATRNGTLVKLYVDGVPVSSVTTAGVTNLYNTYSMRVGELDNAPFDSPFQGMVDELAMWNGAALTDSEVALIYSRQSAPRNATIVSRVMDSRNSTNWKSLSWTASLPFGKQLPDNSGSSPVEQKRYYSGNESDYLLSGMVGLWHLNETSFASSATVKDTSGSGNDATAYNSPKNETNCAFGGTNCVGFKASSQQYIQMPNSASLDHVTEGDYTISAWFFPRVLPPCTQSQGTSSDCAEMILGKSGAHMGLIYNQNGQIQTTHWFQDSTGCGNNSTTIALNKWHHALMTISKSTGKGQLFVDGQDFSSGGCGSFTPNKPGFVYSAPFRSGWAGTGSAFQWFSNGIVDELAVWNRSLTSAQALEVYRRGANRLKFQVRACSDVNCATANAQVATGQGWKGPDNTNLSYYSELNNAISGQVLASPNLMNFSSFSGLNYPSARWFQYRAILESDQTSTCNGNYCQPDLKSVKLSP